MPNSSPFQRAREAPNLPTGTVKFILYCISSFPGLLILMLVLETGQAACNILVPYAVKAIMDDVASLTNGNGPVLKTLQQPLLLLAGLALAEIIFSRASGALLIIIGKAESNCSEGRTLHGGTIRRS